MNLLLLAWQASMGALPLPQNLEVTVGAVPVPTPDFRHRRKSFHVISVIECVTLTLTHPTATTITRPKPQ